ncbi:MAG: DNA adenine methylase [Pirellulales bacterium]
MDEQATDYLPVEVVKAVGRWPVPHPIPYQGSKRNLAQVILSYFPDQFERLVEPFAGSAAISLASAYRKLTDRFWINDGHEPIVHLWTEIVERPRELAAEYEQLWMSQIGQERTFYDHVRAEFNHNRRPALFLYLLARCVKAAIRYNGSGEFNNSPDNRRKGAAPETMRSRIEGAAELLRGRTKVTCADYLTILDQCKASDVIYMDPPYQGVCGNRDNRYAPKIDHEEFCDALARLNESGRMYAVSYDGRMDAKIYGKPLPLQLNLVHIEIFAGRSTQATLLGRTSNTFESLYLSPALAEIISASSRRRPSDSQQAFCW